MIKFDYPIEQIELGIKCFGKAFVVCTWNGEILDANLTISKEKIKPQNSLSIAFAKLDPADEDSYATLQFFLINGGSFKKQIEEEEIKIDKALHPDAPQTIKFDGYFGYVSTLNIDIHNDQSLLNKAAWTIANSEFEYVKWPMKTGTHRTKTFDTVLRDAKFMYTGSTPPHTEEISKVINDTKLGQLREPVAQNSRANIEKWLVSSKRIAMYGLEDFDHFTHSTGVSDSLESFVHSTRVIFMPSKMYYMHGELLEGTEIIRMDPFQGTSNPNCQIPLYANVLLEYPSPWYTIKQLNEIISQAKDKKAKIALDLTWLPISTETLNLNFEGIDQIFFSMNKTWPVADLRPAFRWSRTRINDRQTFDSEIEMYPKTSANMFNILIQQFDFDYVYNKHFAAVENIRNTFDLETTPVLWFTKHPSAVHDTKGYISSHYFLDEFVCVQKLLNYKGKYFW